MSQYMERKFKDAFENGCQFWTGEDGTLMSLVIMRRQDWPEVLQANYGHLFHAEKFDATRGRPRFAYRGAPEEPWQWPGLRKLWMVGDEPTDFPVIEYELEIPR